MQRSDKKLYELLTQTIQLQLEKEIISRLKNYVDHQVIQSSQFIDDADIVLLKTVVQLWNDYIEVVKIIRAMMAYMVRNLFYY